MDGSAKWLSRLVFITLSMGLASAASAGAGSPGQILKILTLNFNSEIVAFDDPHEHLRDLRFAAIVDWIEQEQPDLVLIQEGWNYKGEPSIAIPLARAVDYDQYYRLGEGFPGLLLDSNVILARRQLRLSQSRFVKLPHSAPHLGDGIHEILPLGSITQAVGARLTLDQGDPVFIYTTHLLGNSESDRKDQLVAMDRAIREHVADNGMDWTQADVIVTGDMNSSPTESGIRYLTEQGYEDSWVMAHPDHALDSEGVTNCGDPYSPRFNPMTLGANQFPVQSDISADARNDYIFARGPKVHVLSSTVLFTHPYGGFWMSDHYGVLTTLAIGGDDPPPIPNPLSDDSTPSAVDRTKVLEVHEEDLDSCGVGADCVLNGSPLLVGMRGFTLVNKSSKRIHAEIRGAGSVLPSNETDLGTGNASAFVLMEPGEYELRIHGPMGSWGGSWGGILVAKLRVGLGDP